MKQDYFSLLCRKNAEKSAELLNFTTSDDKDYISKFNNQKRQNDTIIVRNLARLLLSDITEKPFKTWQFIVNNTEARIAISKNEPPYHVSFSHSPNWMAVAVSPMPIGIDVEETKNARSWRDMIHFLDLPSQKQKIENEIDFLKHWTYSEALFKFKSAEPHTDKINSYPYSPNPNTLLCLVTSSTDFPIQKNGAHLIERHSLKFETSA